MIICLPRNRASDGRSQLAPFVPPDLVDYDSVSVNNLYFTLKKGPRWCFEVTNGEAWNGVPCIEAPCNTTKLKFSVREGHSLGSGAHCEESVRGLIAVVIIG